MSEETNDREVLQWHPAFCASIQIEFADEADTPKENQIPIEDITITFVCYKYPRKLMQHLREVKKLHIVKQEKGIYYVYNDIIPMQVIITSRLTDEMNLWLRNLTDDLRKKSIADKLVKEFTPHQRENNYKSVMDAIVRANRKVFTEVGIVCDALQEIIEEIAEEKTRQKLYSLVIKGLLSAEDVANELGMTVEELETKMKPV